MTLGRQKSQTIHILFASLQFVVVNCVALNTAASGTGQISVRWNCPVVHSVYVADVAIELGFWCSRRFPSVDWLRLVINEIHQSLTKYFSNMFELNDYNVLMNQVMTDLLSQALPGCLWKSPLSFASHSTPCSVPTAQHMLRIRKECEKCTRLCYLYENMSQSQTQSKFHLDFRVFLCFLLFLFFSFSEQSAFFFITTAFVLTAVARLTIYEAMTQATNPFNDLLHRVENYDIELLGHTSTCQRQWQEDGCWLVRRRRDGQEDENP